MNTNVDTIDGQYIKLKKCSKFGFVTLNLNFWLFGSIADVAYDKSTILKYFRCHINN